MSPTTVSLIPAVERFLDTEHALIIGADRPAASDGALIDVFDPASGRLISRVASATAHDVDAAVAAARAALPVWNSLSTAARADLLWRLGEEIAKRADEFGQLETLDNGKPTSESGALDVPLCASLFKYYAGWATKIEGETMTPSGGAAFHVFTRREPVGVVGAIIPWNFPLLMVGYKVGPALAAGNTVVLKPAEQTPLSAIRLVELMLEIGFPPGVVNVVTGDGPGAGAPLAAHLDVDKITFTGENSTGQKILEASKGNMKRLSLELGGKSPSLIFDDADIDAAVAGTFGAIYFNQGQCCIAGARVFVQRSVYDRFLDGLAEKVAGITLGNGLNPTTTMGPVVSAEQQQRVNGLIASGVSAGARAVVGGGTVSSPELADGYFVQPTLFTDVTGDMEIMRREIFGPVGMVGVFDTEDEAVELANATQFGLASGVWTRDVTRTHRIVPRIRAGVVWVNTYGMFDVAIPYGGFKASGYGKELGREALDPYLQTKTVWIDLGG